MNTEYIIYRDGEHIANKKALDKCRRYFQRKGKSYEDFFIYVFKKIFKN